jgi:RNA polymerase sigma-70 factor (ECF subfamily)
VWAALLLDQDDRQEGARVRARSGEPAIERTQRLVARMAAGDRAALTELYAGEGTALLAYLRAFTDDRELAEEVVQDTLLAAWHGAADFSGWASVRSWLLAIARRRAADALGRPRLRVVPEDATGLADLPSGERSSEDLAIAAATRAELAAALARMSPLYREVLDLTFAHGLSSLETAEVLGVPLATVKRRLNHAKQALRALLDDDDRERDAR